MIVTIVCDVLGEENNGTTMAAMNLIRYLQKQGHTVKVLCADKDKLELEDHYVVPNKSFGKSLDKLVEKIGVSLAEPNKEVIERAVVGSDIVHLMVPLALSNAAKKIAREHNIPVTAGFHMQAENLTSYFRLNNIKIANNMVYKFIWKHTYKYVDAIHYPTQFIRGIFEKTVPQAATKKAYVISNGVNDYVQKKVASKPTQMENKIVILSTGRLAREKSQDTLIKAIKYSKYADNIQLILAGQGLKEKYYKRLSKNLKNKPIIKRFSREEIIDVINYCDIYVHPAEIELEGIACLEAICCGKLTIVSNSKRSATKEFAVSNKCIFKKRNPKSLARVIDYFIDHPEEKLECEKKYLQSAVAFSQEECMKKMEEMMQDVISAKKQEKK